MRTVVNISLPKKMAADVARAVKRGKYASTSEFFRDALRAFEGERLLRELRESQREIAAGKGKVLRSLNQLR